MWVVTLLEYITGFVPRPIILRIDEGGFRMVPKPFTGKCWLTEMTPGKYYWIIPWFSEHEVCKIKTQTKDIRPQSVWTSDGYNIVISAAIRYFVRNWMKAQLEVLDYDESLQNIVLGVIQYPIVNVLTINIIIRNNSLRPHHKETTCAGWYVSYIQKPT